MVELATASTTHEKAVPSLAVMDTTCSCPVLMAEVRLIARESVQLNAASMVAESSEHAEQLVELYADEKDPTAQFVHAVEARDAEKVPGQQEKHGCVMVVTAAE